jgi:hypothetical protein
MAEEVAGQDGKIRDIDWIFINNRKKKHYCRQILIVLFVQDNEETTKSGYSNSDLK